MPYPYETEDKTLRKNSTKTITTWIRQAVLITHYSDHETSVEKNRMSIEDAIAFHLNDYGDGKGPRYIKARMRVEKGTGKPLEISLGHHWDFVTVYLDKAYARQSMSSWAFDKYFPGEDEGLNEKGYNVTDLLPLEPKTEAKAERPEGQPLPTPGHPIAPVKITCVRGLWQVWVWSTSVGVYIPQGSPHGSLVEAGNDARHFIPNRSILKGVSA
jgi:hypothetical protein